MLETGLHVMLVVTHVSGSAKSVCFLVVSWWPLTCWRFMSGSVFSSSASCMIMSESDLSQKPVGACSAVAGRRRASRLALSVWMVLEMVVLLGEWPDEADPC
jgi:hypothetical protein